MGPPTGKVENILVANKQMHSRKALVSGPVDGKSPKAEHESDQVGSRRV